MNPGAEWETEYEHFQELEDVFIEEISNERNFDNPEFLKLLVLAIAIDNEGERLGAFASSLLSEACIEKVWCEALWSKFTVAQQVLVFHVKDSKSSHKRQFLHRFIEESGDDFVVSRAQYALEHFV